jgi:hypothetical protein
VTGLLVDVAGWIGALALLTAYALVSGGRVGGRGPTFQALNLVGAVGLLANGVWHGAWPSAALNAVWLVVGLVAVTRIRSATGQRPDSAPDDSRPHHSFHRQEKP